jgi:hypothetical protein
VARFRIGLHDRSVDALGIVGVGEVITTTPMTTTTELIGISLDRTAPSAGRVASRLQLRSTSDRRCGQRGLGGGGAMVDQGVHGGEVATTSSRAR